MNKKILNKVLAKQPKLLFKNALFFAFAKPFTLGLGFEICALRGQAMKMTRVRAGELVFCQMFFMACLRCACTDVKKDSFVVGLRVRQNSPAAGNTVEVKIEKNK
jgi:hypothetical protein